MVESLLSYRKAPKSGQRLKKTYIENKIDQIIAACNEKSEMANSKHPNIRKIGALAIKKSDFCQNNKQQLIDEMIKVNLNPKSYKVNFSALRRYFLKRAETVSIQNPLMA
jgi:hypothetical protein